jgi:hypothetical protein
LVGRPPESPLPHLRAQSAPGFPCALFKERANELAKLERKTRCENESACASTVIASEAKQSSFAAAKKAGLLPPSR